jgi:hypothetical protein
MDYKELKKTDCKKYIEKKGQFNYLSWPFMVDMLRINAPDATIHARTNQDGLPYFKDESGGLVETYIMVGSQEVWNEWLPIMDFKNKALKNPDAMDINKAIQRCKAKCISEYTGIGLYIYMGEDLPDAEQDISKPAVKLMTREQSDKFAELCREEGLLLGETAKAYGIRYVKNRMTSDEFEEAYKILNDNVKTGDVEMSLVVG